MENENAFVTELFEKYHDQLKRYCMRYVRYNARYYPLVDDCIQEAFYKAVLHQNDVMQSPNPYGWLAKCCENYLKSKYRQEKRRAEIIGRNVSYDECGEVEDPKDDILRWLYSDEHHELLTGIYSLLTPAEKKIFRYYYRENLSLQETAEKVGVTPNSARGAVQRIRKKALKLKIPSIFVLIGQCILTFSRII